MQILNDFDLSTTTTFHIPARAKTYVEYSTVEELIDVIKRYDGERRLHIGGGSNLLFTDNFDGIVIHSAMKGIEVVDEFPNGDVIVNAKSGTVWDDFVARTVNENLYGAENLSAIPGEVGASAIQNIGAYGVEAKDIIDSVNLLDTTTCETITLAAKHLKFDYRHSVFKTPDYAGRYIVLSVNYRLSRKERYTLTYGPLRDLATTDTLSLKTVRESIISIRASKLPDPSAYGNAGSFFKNPSINYTHYRLLQSCFPDIPGYANPDGTIKVSAGWLIEHTGMKGRSIGGAMVFPHQCLVIINTGNATASDVVSLCDEIRDKVNQKFNINISPEVIFI